MRVALVYIPAGSSSEALASLAAPMARALEAAGHRVEISEARSGSLLRLTGYDFVILGSEAMGLGGKISPRVQEYLAQAGALTGKRSMAFVRKSGFMSAKALSRLMAAMEAEGMRVTCGEVLSGATEAAAAAASAPVERA